MISRILAGVAAAAIPAWLAVSYARGELTPAYVVGAFVAFMVGLTFWVRIRHGYWLDDADLDRFWRRILRRRQ